jgi:hypothetical protein
MRRKKHEVENHFGNSARGGGIGKGRGHNWGSGRDGSSSSGSSNKPHGDSLEGDPSADRRTHRSSHTNTTVPRYSIRATESSPKHMVPNTTVSSFVNAA